MTSPDVMLVSGLVLAVLSLPAVISAWSDARSPRAAAVMAVIAGGLIAAAAWNWPGGLTLGDVPDAFVRVVGALLR